MHNDYLDIGNNLFTGELALLGLLNISYNLIKYLGDEGVWWMDWIGGNGFQNNTFCLMSYGVWSRSDLMYLYPGNRLIYLFVFMDISTCPPPPCRPQPSVYMQSGSLYTSTVLEL